MSVEKFDYIIAGAGCAGLSLLTRMLQSGRFSNKKILLVDKGPKTANDRTWCFWEKGEGFFEPIVYKSWDKLWVHANGYAELHDISPWRYKMIRGKDFYHCCFDTIARYGNVCIEYGEVESILPTAKDALVIMNGHHFIGDHLFNSIQFAKPALKHNQYYLLQHFKGWVIETATPMFNSAEATLMDFRVQQQPQTNFVYVMPFSATRALVEYTVLSEEVFPDIVYEKELHDYITNFLHIPEFSIIEKESGVIPMTNYPFPVSKGAMINIGTAGGQTKASSGYTFQFIQKQAQQLVDNLLRTGSPFPLKTTARRFKWYDGTLLNILHYNKLPGSYIFTQLFRNNKATDILRFLDNETSIAEEMKIISVLPKKVFTKAALAQLF